MSRRRRVLIAAACMLALTLSVMTFLYRPGVALADDPCGSDPGFWSFSFASWVGCEIAEGNSPTDTFTQVVSPYFQSMSDGIAGLATAIGNLISRVGDVVSAVSSGVSSVITWFTPSTNDFQPVVDALHSAQTAQPFAFFGQLAADVTWVQSQWSAMAGTFGPFTPFHVTSPATMTHARVTTGLKQPAKGAKAPLNKTSSPYDFGPLSGGIADWLWFMEQVGMSQSTVALLFDFFIVLTTVTSILGDIGVRMGSDAPGWAVDNEATMDAERGGIFKGGKSYRVVRQLPGGGRSRYRARYKGR